jgi:uncharacterized protein YfaT (DUF1175 family)
LHASLPGVALDCVGLIRYSAEIGGAFGYRLRGDFGASGNALLTNEGFFVLANTIAEEGDFLPGDIVAVQTAPMQQHLMIWVPGGFVHAHAGLGCVVLMPPPSPWPILNIWRKGI